MRYLFFIVFIQSLFIFQAMSQIAINTNTPVGLLHIDAASNTQNNANTSDDVVVDNDGNVGIGTISPHKALTVNGEFRVGIDKAGMGEGNRFYFRGNDDNTDPIWIARYNNSSDITYIEFNIGNDPFDEPGKKDRMVIGTTLPGTDTFKSLYVIQSDGKIGVNVDNPKYTLDIDGGIYAAEGITIPIDNDADILNNMSFTPPSIAKLTAKNAFMDDATESLETSGGVPLNKVSMRCLRKLEELILYKIQLDDMLKSLHNQLREQDEIISALTRDVQ